MNLRNLGAILNADKEFKSNIKFAFVVAVAVILYGTYYYLNKRIEVLEFRTSGEVEVSLEKSEDILLPAPKQPTQIKKTTARVAYKSRIYNNKTFIKMSNQEFECLARNIYHEARFEPYIGKLAVAQVTFNRVLDGKWGHSFCDVVYAHKQFSWTLDKNLRNQKPHGVRWEQIKHVAKMFQNGVRVRDLDKAKWYHASYVSPRWQNDFKRITKIQTHIFYAKAN